jgi:hypothetical protein
MYNFLLLLMNILMVFYDLGLKWEMGLVVVVKEREMEIGYPTDVKHVAHIGVDGPSGNAPTWVRVLLLCFQGNDKSHTLVYLLSFQNLKLL